MFPNGQRSNKKLIRGLISSAKGRSPPPSSIFYDVVRRYDSYIQINSIESGVDSETDGISKKIQICVERNGMKVLEKIANILEEGRL